MATYNRMKAASRVQERADLQAEIDATTTGRWPRDLDDQMRWSEQTPEYAAKMCQGSLEYLDDLERRLAAGDETLKGWEGWEEAS
jgi:hypothetical protein